MYSPVVFVFALVMAVGASRLRTPEFKVEINKESGLIELDLMDSLGLICHNGDTDNIAKVACGGEGTSSAEGAEGLEEVPEFSVEMTCNGDEAKLSECEHKLQQFHKCHEFVAAHCGGRRSLRWVV